MTVSSASNGDIMNEKTIIPGFGSVVLISYITIDGDRFALCLPRFVSWSLLTKLGAFNLENRERWLKFWDGYNPFVLLDGTVNLEILDVIAISDDEQYARLLYDGTDVANTVVMPVLIPLDKNGNFDKTALKGVEIGTPMYGGTAYFDGQPCENKLFPLAYHHMSIGDSVEGKELPWFVFHGILFGAFYFRINRNFRDFQRRFVEVTVSKEEMLDDIIESESLNPYRVKEYMDLAFESGKFTSTGTEFDRLIPPLSRFGSSGRDFKKKVVYNKLKRYFDLFCK